MWLQLLAPKTIEVRGKPTHFHAGDWVEVGKHDAQLWLSRGEAHVPKVQAQQLVDAKNTCVVARAGQGHAARVALEMYSAIHVTDSADFRILRERTAFWDTSAKVQAAFFPIGFGLLDKWELAVPLYDYKRLALSFGDDDDREDTKNVIRDLRVPVYDVRLIFARKTETTDRIMELWEQEPGDRYLAFFACSLQS